MQLDSDHAAFLVALLRMSPPDKVLNVAIALAGAAGDAFGWATENDPENEFGKILTASFGRRLEEESSAAKPKDDG